MTGRPTLLVVDDQAANVRILSECLGATYEVLFATNGVKALELAHSSRPDLVLLDVQMPGLDGHEVCRRLKSDEVTRGIPVIFLTALKEVGDETRGFALGAVDYITKPFHPPVVEARVRTHLQLKRKMDLLERLAQVDGLTEIPNRRRFDEVLVREWRRALRDRTPFSLVLADVDHFKSFNDGYGHPRGDECLRRVAQALTDALRRPSDLAARYGGEEFGIVLPETGTAGALEVMARILEMVAGLGIPHGHSPAAPRVSVSLGAATLVPDDEAWTRAVETADAALYEAKQAGRDRAIHVDLATGRREVLLPPDPTLPAHPRSQEV